MVFVLAFNLLSYIVDPDKITDKKTGASTFVKDVILTLVILAISPMLFTKLYSLQSRIITSNVIPTLILGGNSSVEGLSSAEYEANKDKYNSVTDYYVSTGANRMAASIYVAFLYPNDGFTALDCEKDTTSHTDYCDAYKEAQTTGSLEKFSDFVKNEDFNYTPFISTVAGIVLLFFMLSFCINLAKRVGKLAIVQLIAPIPCTLELIPSKKGLRDNWLKTLVKVYLEVFFYLGVMYIIVFLISLVPSTVAEIFNEITGDGIGVVALMSGALLIYGLLMFGKEAPQLIFDLLGIKSTGIIKEAALRGVRMAGSLTSGVGTAATSIARNGYGAIDNFAHGHWKEGAGNVAGFFTSGFTGMARGMYANRTGGFKGIVRRTSGAINSNLAHQGEFTGKAWGAAKNIGRTVADGATSGRNVAGIPGFMAGAVGGLVGGVAGTATKSPREAISKWATGSGSYTKLNDQIAALNAAKGYFKSVTTGFGAYEDATRTLNEAKAKTNYATEYSNWKLAQENAVRAANPGLPEDDLKTLIKGATKEKDFIASIAGDARYTEVVNAFNQQKSVKEERISKKEAEIINGALGMLQYIDLNPQISLSEKSAAERDALKAMLDKDGNIIDSTKTIQDVYSKLDDLSTQLGKDITAASRVIERQKIIEEAKKNGNSGSSGGSK